MCDSMNYVVCDNNILVYPLSQGGRCSSFVDGECELLVQQGIGESYLFCIHGEGVVFVAVDTGWALVGGKVEQEGK